MLLFCSRHGETDFNAAGRIQGQSDTLLSTLGRRQAELLAAALADSGIDAIYSSPLRRALDTAGAVAEALRLPVITDPRLAEIHIGHFQDHTWEEIDRLFPDDARGWRSRDPDFRVTGGETRRELMARGRAGFEAIRSGDYRRPLVVSHGGLLSAVFKSLLDIPAVRSPFSLSNGSITRISWNGDDVKLLTVNETAHLAQLASSGGEL